MSQEPEVVRGLLGWSNKRPGLEFYRWDDRTIPRHGTEWGDLLIDEITGRPEGSPVIVAVLPRSWSGTEIQAIEKALEEALGA